MVQLNKLYTILIQSAFLQTGCLILVFNLPFILTCAQETDTLQLANDSLSVNTIDTTNLNKKDSLLFKPKRAVLLSAIVPGLGQAYNKQLYKTPIYPGAMVLSFTTHLYYRNLFDKYSNQLNNLSNNLLPNEEELRNLTRIQQNNSRQIANTALFMTGFFYVANVIDAYASAGIKNTTVKNQHSPVLAAYRSAALPGLGQVYNKQYWKAPLVWAALAGAGGSAYYFYQRRKCYSDVYLNRLRYNYDDDELFNKCFDDPNGVKNSSTTYLLRKREAHKKNLDWSLIAVGAVYLLNIADAIVYGHLKNFDIDDNLDLSVKPVFHYQTNDVSFAGVGIVLKL